MKKVSFVYVENSCRSQIAKGFINSFPTDDYADRAGTQPAETIDLITIKVMREIDIDINHWQLKMISPPMNNEFDYIVTMGCIDGCPLTPKDKTIAWNIPDPKRKSIDIFREIRNNIRKQVVTLPGEIR